MIIAAVGVRLNIKVLKCESDHMIVRHLYEPPTVIIGIIVLWVVGGYNGPLFTLAQSPTSTRYCLVGCKETLKNKNNNLHI